MKLEKLRLTDKFFVIVLIALFVPFNDACARDAKCNADTSDIRCFKINYGKLKNTSSGRMEIEKRILSYGKAAVECSDTTFTAEYLSLIKFIKDSSALQEYYAEIVEGNLIGNNTVCFLEAYALLPKEEKALVADHLSRPVFKTNTFIRAKLLKYNSRGMYVDDVFFLLSKIRP